MLDATLDARPAVYAVWVVISLLTVPMFMMSSKELAPAEDQGVIFGILDASANSTLDQNSRYAAQVNKAFMSTPETEFTFQITQPASRFRRHGGQALGQAQAHDLPDHARSAAQSSRPSRACRCSR